MILLDPFYGVFSTGKEIAKWLNRALLLAEAASIVQLTLYTIKADFMEPWYWIIYAVVVVAAIHLANLVVRWLWNAVLVLFYGTSDAEEILEKHQARLDRRIRRRKRREARRAAKEDRENQAELSKFENEHPEVDLRHLDIGEDTPW